jgi:hypothetical protein
MPNTVAQNLQRLQTARTNIANAITNKGGTVPSGSGFEDFSNLILQIPTAQVDENVRLKISRPILNDNASNITLNGNYTDINDYITKNTHVFRTIYTPTFFSTLIWAGYDTDIDSINENVLKCSTPSSCRIKVFIPDIYNVFSQQTVDLIKLSFIKEAGASDIYGEQYYSDNGFAPFSNDWSSTANGSASMSYRGGIITATMNNCLEVDFVEAPQKGILFRCYINKKTNTDFTANLSFESRLLGITFKLNQPFYGDIPFDYDDTL